MIDSTPGADVAAYDIIGDVHGCATKLHRLLDTLGWELGRDGIRRHADPERKVVFVGDLIDGGDEQLAALTTVRSMVEARTALVTMGNHEFNAISYATPHPGRAEDFLRPHTKKNDAQHSKFLALEADERAEWIAWFRTLPLWLELDGLRIVHACWHQRSIDLLATEFGGSTFPPGDEGFIRANTKGDPIWDAIEVILKGPEIELEPYGLPPYLDNGGHVRHRARARWWFPDPCSVREIVDMPGDATNELGLAYPTVPELPCRSEDREFSYTDDVPVVFGHHWRRWEPDEHLDWTPRAACVDFSAVKDGHMVAYRWNGDDRIDPSNYVQFPPPST